MSMTSRRMFRGSVKSITPPTGLLADQTTSKPPTGWESYQSLDVSAGGAFILLNDTDYKIVNQTASENVRLRGGRRVVIMGLTVNINRPSTWTNESEAATTGLELQENPYPSGDSRSGGAAQANRMFHCEGVLVQGPHLTQGVRTVCPFADVVLANFHVAMIRFNDCDHRDGTNGNTANHPDLIQTYGGAKSLTLDGFTGYSSYQGLFFKEDNTIVGGPISLRRVDVHGGEITAADGYDYAGHRMLWNFRAQPITAHGDSVWVQGHVRNGWQPRQGAGSGFHKIRYWSGSSYQLDPVPSSGTDEMAISPSPNSVQSDGLGSYANVDDVSGVIRLGAPGGGEYVPADQVGAGYQF